MMNMNATALAAAVLSLAASAADAASTTFTSRAAFEAAATITGTEDFNGFAAEVDFRTTPLDVGPFSLSTTDTFANRNFIDLQPVQFSVFDVDGTTIVNGIVYDGTSLFINFDTAISAFGVDLAAINNDVLRSLIFIGGESFAPAVTVGEQVRFFGVTTMNDFTTVEIRGVNPAAGDGFGLDNVAFGTAAVVPEPGTLTMAGLGLVGLAGAARRRRRARDASDRA